MRRRISGILNAIGANATGDCPLLGSECDAHCGQEGQGQHRQGDVPVPAVPTTDLIAIQADLLLGRFEAFLDFPPLTGHAGQRHQTRVGRTEDNVVGEFVRVGDRPAHQQPVISRRLLEAKQAKPKA
jgi:hypothetical protein